MSTADVQLVPRDGLVADELLDRLGRGAGRCATSLVERGGGSTSRAGRPGRASAAAESANLPDPGVLNALRDLW